MNKRTDMLGRNWWNLHAANGAVIRIIDDQKKDYFQISTPQTSFQCPKEWLTICRHLDEYNAPDSHHSQTIVMLCITAPQVENTLATLLLDPREFADICGDPVLSQLAGSKNLSREQCAPVSGIDF